MIRPGRDEDADRFIALIARCWADYPNCPLDVDGEAPELRALASHYAGLGGALWIAGEGDGMIATRPAASGAWETCRVYVHPDRHGTGLGAALLAVAEAYSGADRFELWSDTRFERAHWFYQKHGYRATGRLRELHDLGRSTEAEFQKGKPPPTLLD